LLHGKCFILVIINSKDKKHAQNIKNKNSKRAPKANNSVRYKFRSWRKGSKTEAYGLWTYFQRLDLPKIFGLWRNFSGSSSAALAIILFIESKKVKFD
jgi:hypothetical protein